MHVVDLGPRAVRRETERRSEIKREKERRGRGERVRRRTKMKGGERSERVRD